MKYSTSWLRSKQPRKQRKYRYNAPLHLKGKFLGVNLSRNLRKKHGKRTLRVRKGDQVKVMRGSYKGREGKVERIEHGLVYIQGIELNKRDGSKAYPGMQPSNLMITELNLDDKRRFGEDANPVAKKQESPDEQKKKSSKGEGKKEPTKKKPVKKKSARKIRQSKTGKKSSKGSPKNTSSKNTRKSSKTKEARK